jgi:putative CRISPR-associated protein (TIGR02620 family)
METFINKWCIDIYTIKEVINMKVEKVIVTRHLATAEWLKERIGEAKVLSHLNSVDDISQNSVVYGVLPIHIIHELKARGVRVVITTLTLPPELRGKELTQQDINSVGGIKLIEVEKLQLKEMTIQ